MRHLGRLAVVGALLTVAGCFKMDVDLGGGKGEKKPPASSQLPATETGGSWQDVARRAAGGAFVDADHGAVFYAFDTLAYPRKPVDLVVKLRSAKTLQAIAGVTVAFTRGDWLAGRVTTNADGVARLRWTPPRAANYTFTAKIVAVGDVKQADLLQVAPATLLVAARDRSDRFVVIDLDHTIVDSSFFRVLMDGGRPMAESVAVTKRIARTFGIIYLTHRPDLLTRKSKTWLIRNGYPPGPLLVSEMRNVLDSGEFKTAKLSEVRKAFPNVAIGIGDKLSDAQAYVDNGLTAYLIPHYKRNRGDMREMARQVRKLRGKGRLQVVTGWREVEQGIFGGRKYPPAVFATMLDNRADRMEAERRERKKRDDDDDDDDDDD